MQVILLLIRTILLRTNKNIADNKAAITKNASDIATNKDNIDKNTTAIGRKISLVVTLVLLMKNP